MDELLAKLLATAAAPLIAALNRNSDNLERVIAGQEAAMAKLEGVSAGGTTPRTRRSSKPADEKSADPAPVAETKAPVATTTKSAEPAHPLLSAPNGETVPVKNAKTGEDEDTPTGKYRASDFSREQVKNEFIGWLGDTDNIDERKARAAFVGEIGAHFGVKQPFNPEHGLTDDEQRKQTLFFLRRKREGLAVNFSADYDFDADPLADQTAEAAEEEVEDALG